MRSKRVEFEKLDVIDCLPNSFHPDDGDDYPTDLIGAKIVRFGTVDKDDAANTEPSLEGGGLVIDYVSEGATCPSRLVLAFNGLGMWVASVSRM